MRIRKDVAFLVVVAVVVLLAAGIFVMWKRQKREDGFFSNVGGFFKGVGQKTAEIGKTVGTTVVNAGKTAGTVVGIVPPPYAPTYSGRQWDNFDWSCPWWTVETGFQEPKACYNKPYTTQVWRWDGTKWGWSCPNGTVPNNDGQWEKKCLVGYMGRVYTDKGYMCPSGTTDTGKNWDNSDWYTAQQQCQRGGPYTTRIPVNGKWVCPPGSKDTGMSWGNTDPKDPDRGWKQCMWVGP